MVRNGEQCDTIGTRILGDHRYCNRHAGLAVKTCPGCDRRIEAALFGCHLHYMAWPMFDAWCTAYFAGNPTLVPERSNHLALEAIRRARTLNGAQEDPATSSDSDSTQSDDGPDLCEATVGRPDAPRQCLQYGTTVLDSRLYCAQSHARTAPVTNCRRCRRRIYVKGAEECWKCGKGASVTQTLPVLTIMRICAEDLASQPAQTRQRIRAAAAVPASVAPTLLPAPVPSNAVTPRRAPGGKVPGAPVKAAARRSPMSWGEAAQLARSASPAPAQPVQLARPTSPTVQLARPTSPTVQLARPASPAPVQWDTPSPGQWARLDPPSPPQWMAPSARPAPDAGWSPRSGTAAKWSPLSGAGQPVSWTASVPTSPAQRALEVAQWKSAAPAADSAHQTATPKRRSPSPTGGEDWQMVDGQPASVRASPVYRSPSPAAPVGSHTRFASESIFTVENRRSPSPPVARKLELAPTPQVPLQESAAVPVRTDSLPRPWAKSRTNLAQAAPHDSDRRDGAARAGGW